MATNIRTQTNLQARVPITDPKTGQSSKDFLQKYNELVKQFNALVAFVNAQHP